MTAGKKSSRSSQSTHTQTVVAGADAKAPDPVPGSPAAPAPAAPRLDAVRANDEALAGIILEALTKEAQELEPPAAEAPKPDAQADDPRGLPVQSPPAEPDSPKAEAAPRPREAAAPAGQTYYNITQALVESRALDYMQMLDLCTCPRCQADVKAAALSNLPPKYVVMQPGEITPMLSVYEGQLGPAVTVQILAACRLVRDNPRH